MLGRRLRRRCVLILAAKFIELADFGLAKIMGPQGQEVASIVGVRILLIEWAMMPNTAREQLTNLL